MDTMKLKPTAKGYIVFWRAIECNLRRSLLACPPPLLLSEPLMVGCGAARETGPLRGIREAMSGPEGSRAQPEGLAWPLARPDLQAASRVEVRDHSQLLEEVPNARESWPIIANVEALGFACR
ncbi:unnamed protein product [Boreogadus saida]